MLSQIRCVAFDAVGTVIFPDPPVGQVYARVGRKHGSDLSEDEVRARFREAFCNEYAQPIPTSEAEERLRWRRIVEAVFRLEEVSACFEELFEHFGRPGAWRCFPEVEITLRELSKRGYDLVLASNFDRRLHAVCEGHRELGSFARRVISSEVGVFKPHAAYYRALLNMTGFKEHEVLMVGDDWTNDILGALDVGINAIYLDRSQAQPGRRADSVMAISSLADLLGLLP